MGLHTLLGEIRQSIYLFCGFVFTSQMALLFNINLYFDCKIRVCLIVPGRYEKFISAQEGFYLQDILNDINQQGTSFLDCKHKYMMKCRAPTDKFKVLYYMFTYRILWFHKQNYHCLVPVLISIFFRNGMGPFQVIMSSFVDLVCFYTSVMCIFIYFLHMYQCCRYLQYFSSAAMLAHQVFFSD